MSCGRCALSWPGIGGEVLKRALDLVVALVGLVLLAPVLAVIAVLVKCGSPGPILYVGERIGRNGRPFRMAKFRSMAVDADQRGPAITYSGDLRVTRVGAWLRRTKLDELPQLWNVLRGDMSLVGPRPEAPPYVALYTPEQRQVLQVRPGITGLTQLTYRKEEEQLSPTTWEEDYVHVLLPRKLALDLEYIRRQSLVLDLQILACTAWLLVRDRLTHCDDNHGH